MLGRYLQNYITESYFHAYSFIRNTQLIGQRERITANNEVTLQRYLQLANALHKIDCKNIVVE